MKPALPLALRERTIVRIFRRLAVRPRHIAPVALFLALTVAGFIVARRARPSEECDATPSTAPRLRRRRSVAASRRLHRSPRASAGSCWTPAVPASASDQFARNASRWLSPARLPGRRMGRAGSRFTACGVRAAYRPAHRDARRAPRGGAPRIALLLSAGDAGLWLPSHGRARHRSERRTWDGHGAHPGDPPRRRSRDPDGTRENRHERAVPGRAGAESHRRRSFARGTWWCSYRNRGCVRRPPTRRRCRSAAGRRFDEARERAETASKTFTAAGQRFDVVVPRESVQGAAAVLPWIILAGGLVVAALGGALGLNAARRARAQEELDRIFTLSQDLITVADFDGRFTRVNPAARGDSRLHGGRAPRAAVRRPRPSGRPGENGGGGGRDRSGKADAVVREPVRPQGRLAQGARVDDDPGRRGQAHVRRGTRRDRAPPGRGRGGAARRRAGGAAAGGDARRARRVPSGALHRDRGGDARSCSAPRTSGWSATRTTATSGRAGERGYVQDVFPTGSRQPLGGENAASRVFRTGQPARIDDYRRASGPIAEAVRRPAFAAPWPRPSWWRAGSGAP